MIFPALRALSVGITYGILHVDVSRSRPVYAVPRMDDDAWKEHPFVKKNFNDVDSVTRTLMRKATSPWWKFFDFAKFSVAEAGASHECPT